MPDDLDSMLGDAPNRSVNPKSASVADLIRSMSAALESPLPDESTPLATLTDLATKWGDILDDIEASTGELAWLVGHVLMLIKKQVGHGNWENHFNEKLKGTRGIGSLSTAKRHMRVARSLDREQTRGKTKTEVYEMAGILSPSKTSADEAIETLQQFTEDMEGIIRRLYFFARKRQEVLDQIQDVDYEDRDLCQSVIAADINFEFQFFQIIAMLYKQLGEDASFYHDERIKTYLQQIPDLYPNVA